jgi:hypothetical protein
MDIDVIKNLSDYKLAIEHLANTCDPYVFANSGQDHACIVMSNIFRTAKNHVNIFARDLRGDVSKGEYLTSFENYLKTPGTSMSVLLEETPKPQSQAFEILKRHKRDNVKVYLINAVAKAAFTENGVLNHFTTADNRMFRFETDTEKYMAVCGFNDSGTVKILDERFSLLSNNCTSLL